MTHINYHRDSHIVTATGHAGFAPVGQDIVCSAISILLYTLAADIGEGVEAGMVQRQDVQLNPGESAVSCVPHSAFKVPVTWMFDAVCSGFTLLAQQYPEFVSYTTHND